MKDRRKEEGNAPDGAEERRQPDQAPEPAPAPAPTEEESGEGDTDARIVALEQERDELRQEVQRGAARLRRAIKRARQGAPPEDSIDPPPAEPPEPVTRPRKDHLGGFISSIARSMRKK